MTDLERAFIELKTKEPNLSRLWKYYQGEQPMVYANEALRKRLHITNSKFVQNWTTVVVDSVHDRINLTGFEHPEQQVSDKMAEMFRRGEMGILADDVHEGALVLGESFIIVWLNAEGEVWPYYNDARLCTIFYDPSDPYVVSYAAKWYIDSQTDRLKLTLYYPDRLEHYSADKDADSAKKLRPDEAAPVEPNPYGQVPVFRFTQTRNGRSEIENILPLQDSINKLQSDMMRAAETGAYRQRWMITDADTSHLINAPDEIWTIPASSGEGQGVQVGEFGETSLGNYLDAIDRTVRAVGVISRTPQHYFYSTGGTPSGEALIAMEAPLLKKVQDYIQRYSSTWQKVMAFMLLLEGYTVEPQDVIPKFAPIETVQPMTQAQVMQLERSAGFPLFTILRKRGWTEPELKQLAEDLEEEDSRKQASMAAMFLNSSRQFNQGAEVGG